MAVLSKPTLEKIEPGFGSSFSLRTYYTNSSNKNYSFWHYHPEIELVYVNGGSGKRQIGSHISYYRNGDLILIGSNLPHCAFTDSLTGHECETVLQMKPDFLGEGFFTLTEMRSLQNLFERAKKGIVFHGDTKREIGKKIENLKNLDPFHRLLSLLEIFKALEQTEKYTILNAQGFILETELQDNDRINVVFNFVKEEFQQSIPLEEISNKVNMTTPAFCRYFKKSRVRLLRVL